MSRIFPDPRTASPDGLLAVGGDLSVPMLLEAYDHGIFPWFNRKPVQWWCPDPRCVVDPEHLHVSKRLAWTLRRGTFTITWNRAFRQVMKECGARRAEGTWIVPSMVEAYGQLHLSGHAHSIEVWAGDELAGGLYGVQRGAAFMGESMFHRVTDASKVALILAVRQLFDAGFRLFDVQFLTDHLASLGAYEISRDEYLRRLALARIQPVALPWATPPAAGGKTER